MGRIPCRRIRQGARSASRQPFGVGIRPDPPDSACRASRLNQALRRSVFSKCQPLLLGYCRQTPVLGP